jgi:hypothetical protein
MTCNCFAFVHRPRLVNPPHRLSSRGIFIQNAMLENIACALREGLVLNLLPGSFSVQR